MAVPTKRYEALSQRLNAVEETYSTYAESRIPLEQMSLRTLAPAAEQIVPLIRINGVKEDDMPFMLKRRRGRRRGLLWLSLGGCMVLFVVGLLLCGSAVRENQVQQQVLQPVIRETWRGWANTRYMFVLYGPEREMKLTIVGILIQQWGMM